MVKKAIKKKSHLVKNKKTIKTSIKNKPSSKKKITSSHHQKIYVSPNESNTEKILIENFVSLQKVMTHLSIKFDNLTKQISKLLELFEISAKELAKKDFDLKKTGKDKKIIEKIDNLLDQNKIIAKGLTLMHEKIPEQKINYPTVQAPPQIQQRQVPEPQVKIEGYQKSISPESPRTNLQKR